MTMQDKSPRLKWILPIAFIVIGIAACATVWFVTVLKPSSAGAFIFFVLWLVLPYAAMAATLVFLSSGSSALPHCAWLAGLLGIAGILFLAEVIFWHLDAQGALAVLMVPLLQIGAFTILFPLLRWRSRSR